MVDDASQCSPVREGETVKVCGIENVLHLTGKEGVRE